MIRVKAQRWQVWVWTWKNKCKSCENWMDGNLLYMILTCIYRKILKDAVFDWSMMLDLERDSEWWVKVFFFFGGGLLSQKPTDWAIDGFKKSRVVSTAFGGRRCFFWNCWRYLYLTCFLWEFIVMPKRCQEPCKRGTDAYIYIFAHYISVQHGGLGFATPLKLTKFRSRNRL